MVLGFTFKTSATRKAAFCSFVLLELPYHAYTLFPVCNTKVVEELREAATCTEKVGSIVTLVLLSLDRKLMKISNGWNRS